MRILGLQDSIDSAAAIIENGRVIAAIGEERMVRKKMAYGFPRAAIRAVLETARVTPGDIDYIAVAGRNNYLVNEVVPFNGWFETRPGLFRRLFLSMASKASPLAARLAFLEKSYYGMRAPVFAYRRWKIREILRTELGFSARPVFIDHHFAHACSAYHSAGFENATVVTLDGGGDGLCSRVYAVRAGKFKPLQQLTSLNSIGNFYSYITHISGFKTHRHEGKITGLAAYGDPRYVDLLKSMIDWRDGRIVNDSKLFGSSAVARIRNLLPPDFSNADLAASIQQHLEHVAVRYVQEWVHKTQIPDLAVAGGVFANVKLNQRINQLGAVDRIHIHPAMGDDGIAVGAALALYQTLQSSRGRAAPGTRCMDHVYLGPDFSNDEIGAHLRKSGLPYRVCVDVESEVAALLSQGRVVARFNGRMEYGPRALGNRSILYQPTDPSVNGWLNQRLKRTEFMPFAPSTLAEHAERCYSAINGASDAARFMTVTFNCTEWMKQCCPAVVHVDGTARPQLVHRNDNPSFYKIIDEYRKRTGLPSVVNTSFNIHEEPIVCSPADAVRAFMIGHLDYLAIGPFLVANPNTVGASEWHAQRSRSSISPLVPA